MSSDFQDRFLSFLENCPVPYLFVQMMKQLLSKNGFIELKEKDVWTDIPKKAFVVRDNRSIIAFKVGGYDSAMIVGGFSDSPCLKIRDKPNLKNDSLNQVHVYTYGTGLWQSWLGRDLRLVGSVTVRENGGLNFRFINSKDPIAFIPVHNVGLKPNVNTEAELRPILGGIGSQTLIEYVAKRLKVNEEDIVDWDLSFVDANPPNVLRRLVQSQSLGSFGSTFSAVEAFMNSEPKNTINMLAVFDNELVGSRSRFGTKGDFLEFVIKRLVGGIDKYIPFIAKSFLVISDYAYALNPNSSGTHEGGHQPYIFKGVVVKSSTTSSCATDLTSVYPIKHAAKSAKIPLQYFIKRNDTREFSYNGPALATKLGISTVNIGIPQFSVHSIRGTMHISDALHLTALLEELYNNYEEHRLKL